ncbi:MAG TPA: DUF1566 domain-containing protein [Anaerolineales bacterium]|nr:DUF1566 domain-containing protein [Anaerolineales bacterium]
MKKNGNLNKNERGSLFQCLLTATVPMPLVLIVALLSTTVGVYAASGTTDSSAAPNATSSYTLEDIYQRLDTYTHATQSTFSEPSVAPGTGTMHTLNDIYALLDQRAFLPQTGVTTCYDNTGTLTDCAGTGEDGEYQMGIAPPSPRFVDNGDGTVTDNLTQLIWLQWQTCMKLAEGMGTYNVGTYDAVLEGANNLQDGQCGLTDGSNAGDWRLPNLYELLSVTGISSDSLATPLPAPFEIGDIGGLWASINCPRVTSSTHIGPYVYLTGGGGITRIDKTSTTFYGWAVRGGN